MRRWRGVVLALAVIAAAGVVRAAGPADGPGCVQVTLNDCLQWLRATATVDESFLANALQRRQVVDVNGKRIGGIVTVYARLPGHVEPFVILLHVTPDDRIERAESNLLSNIVSARTEDVYDRSAFYDIAWRLLGRRCGASTKLDLYRFFENSVKPQIKQDRQDVANGLFGLHRVVSHAAAVPLCGVAFAYTNLTEWRGGASSTPGANATNFSSIGLR